jgi:3-deoxy-7-phosphoheptulonate synthase
MSVVVVINEQCTSAERAEVLAAAEAVGSGVSVHTETLLSVSGDAEEVTAALDGQPAVRNVAALGGAYPLASAESRCGRQSTVRLGAAALGSDQFVVIAGPCAVETRNQLLDTARSVRAAGGHALRGGAFKPRTSPYAFHGLGHEGLRLLAEARAETGLPVVTEVVDVRDLEQVADVAVRVPRPRSRGPAPARRGEGRDGVAGRHRGRRRP